MIARTQARATARSTAWIAAGLVVVATLCPIIAWYFAGSEEAERLAMRIEAQGVAREGEVATRLAARLGERFEQIRESESRRPWYQYQPFYHDPRGLSEGIALVPSPLSQGRVDPLIRLHFEVDASGRVASPSMPGAPALPTEDGLALRAVAPACEPSDLAQVEITNAFAFAQNVLAPEIVANNGQAPVGLRTTGPDVAVLTTPLTWRSVRMVGVFELVAIRCVQTPRGRLVQGFIIDDDAADDWLRAAAPARLGPASPAMLSAKLPLHGADWAVRVSNPALAADSKERAELVRARFRQRFALGGTLAVVASVAAVVLVVQAQSLARRRGEFAAAAAHELRTPLASIRLHAELLGDAAPGGDGWRRHARVVIEESERLGRVIANVLAHSRLERAAPSVDVRQASLAEAVTDIVERQRVVLEAAGMTVTTDSAGGLPRAWLDRDALAEILGNLLDNAERHSRGVAARSVTVQVRRSRPGWQCVLVRDSGPGLPKARRRIFDAFARQDPGVSKGRTSSGLGLGLFIARRLCRAQGGTLDLDDAPGGGAEARIELRES